MMHRRFAPALFVLFSALVARAEVSATQPSTDAGAKFIRYVEEPDGSARLETGEASYRNAAGVSVTLIGAVHIADEAYFKGLDDSFDRYDAVLYEMVKPKDPAAAARSTEARWIGNLQRFMKDKLKLSFQLEQIDYTRKNFVHADMTWEQFDELQQQRGESMTSLMLRSMFAESARSLSSKPKSRPVTMPEILLAMMSPDSSYEMRRLLARQFGDAEASLASLEGPNGSVIIGERNKVALNVLRNEIGNGKKRLAVFYGAGHLASMEKTLTSDMGFHLTGIVYRTAWDLPAAPAGSLKRDRNPTTTSSTRPTE